MNRRDWIKTAGMSAGVLLPAAAAQGTTIAMPSGEFRYCLNTSTISGQGLPLPDMIEIMARAGYDGVEIWIRDIEAHLATGASLISIARHIRDAGVKVENAIGFAPVLVADETQRREGLIQLKYEMDMLAELGGRRIAAPPAGVDKNEPIDLTAMGTRYAEALELGRTTGVMPQLEFWGASGTLYNLGQLLHVAAAANDPDARLLPDVYHLFRGGSGFDGLKMIHGSAIEIFHMNDYPATPARERQTDAHRVFPGDGVAPLSSILTDLKRMGGTKVLSLELFNRDYWKLDPLAVAESGLESMRRATKAIARA